MKNLFSCLCKTRWHFYLCLINMVLFFSCTTIDPASVSTFKQGISAVRTDSLTILLEFNRFIRDLKLDRAEKLKMLKESDVAPGIDAESITRWNSALEGLSLYASSLEILAVPVDASKTVEKSLKSLGDRIIALSPSKDPSISREDELNLAISHIGKLIVETTAKQKALEIASEADPSVRAVLLQMADMIGKDQTSGGLRSTMWSNWTTRADQQRVKFLRSKSNKRKIAAKYADALEGRLASDVALNALRNALMDLADLHTAMSQGRIADASQIITLLRQEVVYAKQLLESAQSSNSKGDTK